MSQPIHRMLQVKLYHHEAPTAVKDGNRFLEHLVLGIGMKAVTKPQTAYVDIPNFEGLTGSINLCTSHIAYHSFISSGHFKPHLLMLTIYSCKHFSTRVVLELTVQHFKKPVNGHFMLIDNEHLHVMETGIIVASEGKLILEKNNE